MSSTITDRVAVLKAELRSLKQAERQVEKARSESRKWVSVQKRRPDSDTRALAWSDSQLKFAWFTNGKWFQFDGTWFVKAKDEITATHWMGTDWMTSEWFPSRGPGFRNWIKAVLAGGAYHATNLVRPKSSMRNAQISRKVIFYRDQSGKLMTGMPESMPVPAGCEMIACGSALEAERLSDTQRRQERAEHGRRMEERERIEGEIHKEIRSEMHAKMANARNAVNRDFLRRAIERDERRKGHPTQYERESFLHSEGYEQGR